MLYPQNNAFRQVFYLSGILEFAFGPQDIDLEQGWHPDIRPRELWQEG